MRSKVFRNLRRCMSYQQNAELREKHLFPCMTAHFAEPVLIERGEMQVISYPLYFTSTFSSVFIRPRWQEIPRSLRRHRDRFGRTLPPARQQSPQRTNRPALAHDTNLLVPTNPWIRQEAGRQVPRRTRPSLFCQFWIRSKRLGDDVGQIAHRQI